MTDKEDIAMRKMALLLDSIKSVETMDNLREDAFEVILTHPGIDKAHWAAVLITEYKETLYDALNPTGFADICDKLDNLWMEQYYDEASGQTHTYQEWSQVISDETSLMMYYNLVEKHKK